MALSFAMTTTPVVCVSVMEERSRAAKCLVMEAVPTLSSHLDNAVANVNVRKGGLKLSPHF